MIIRGWQKLSAFFTFCFFIRTNMTMEVYDY